jgi:dipeptide/tripeptide permease
MDDETQLWGGAALLLLGTVILFAPQILTLQYTTLLLSVAVLVLAGGALLVGLSRRGRTV